MVGLIRCRPRRGSSASSYSAAQVDAAAEHGQDERRQAEFLDALHLPVLERDALRVVGGLAQKGRHDLVLVGGEAAALEGGADGLDGKGARRRRRNCASVSTGGRVMFTMTPPTGRPSARSSATPSIVSWTGISSSRVTRWTAVRGEAMTAMTRSAWLRIGPTFARPEISEFTLRNLLMRPVGGASRTTASYMSCGGLVAAADHLDRLAGEQHVAQSRARSW